jgi:hypothetical protein
VTTAGGDVGRGSNASIVVVMGADGIQYGMLGSKEECGDRVKRTVAKRCNVLDNHPGGNARNCSLRIFCMKHKLPLHSLCCTFPSSSCRRTVEGEGPNSRPSSYHTQGCCGFTSRAGQDT